MKARTVQYRTEAIRHHGPETWEMLPLNIDAETLTEFNAKIKSWKPIDCTCVGYVKT